jgi:hypothetical protein
VQLTAEEETRPDDNSERFEDLGSAGGQSLVSEFLYFLVHNKKWWLIPILLVMGLIGVLAVLGGSGAAPFIYTLF